MLKDRSVWTSLRMFVCDVAFVAAVLCGAAAGVAGLFSLCAAILWVLVAAACSSAGVAPPSYGAVFSALPVVGLACMAVGLAGGQAGCRRDRGDDPVS